MKDVDDIMRSRLQGEATVFALCIQKLTQILKDG
jgi:hypothetical protein